MPHWQTGEGQERKGKIGKGKLFLCDLAFMFIVKGDRHVCRVDPTANQIVQKKKKRLAGLLPP